MAHEEATGRYFAGLGDIPLVSMLGIVLANNFRDDGSSSGSVVGLSS